MSEEHEERIEREIDNDNGDFEENSDIAEPVEIIREEVVEVVENPTAETFPLSSMETQHEDEEEQKKEIKTENLNRYNEDIYEQVKAQSIQLNSLAEMVESLQSQVQQLQETTRLRKHHNTISVRKKRTSNSSTKTKRKTKTRGSARSRKK
ncbi:MAG: hypothetical protein WBE68_22570 [Candidatus Nitrosopolaris sp.]